MTVSRLYRCRRTVEGKDRCPFEGDHDELREHAREAEHWLCIVCCQSLADDETQTCQRCVTRTHRNLTAIVEGYALLPTVVEACGYHQGRLPGGDALVMLADGSLQGGGPDDWISDPTPVIAVLESNERDWRHEFGHPPAEDIATVTGCAGYLLRYLHNAARWHPGFDDFAHEVATLRNRLDHVMGTANDPQSAAADCFDCGGQLERPYTDKGLSDVAICRQCKREYDGPTYGLALRMRARSASGWVPVKVAAEVLRRPEQTIWRWLREGLISAACAVSSRRVVVDMGDTRERDDEAKRRNHRSECA